MDRSRRFFLTAVEIAFIGRPMADLLERRRSWWERLSVDEKIKRMEEIEELLTVRGPIANYDPRYGDPGDIQMMI